MGTKEDKTNVMRILDQKRVSYKAHSYDSAEALSGTEVASVLGVDPEKVFKTLVTVGKSGQHYVFVIPSVRELDLRAAAKAVGEKNIEMLRSKDLLGLTGYIHGGCSPIGMKKFFATTVDESALLHDTILVSAGRIGRQIEISPRSLEEVIKLGYASLCTGQ